MRNKATWITREGKKSVEWERNGVRPSEKIHAVLLWKMDKGVLETF
jgi:hypothetical protein